MESFNRDLFLKLSQFRPLLIIKTVISMGYLQIIYLRKKKRQLQFIQDDPKVEDFMWTVSLGLILLTYHTGVFMMSTIMISKSKELTLRKRLFIPSTVDLIHPYLHTSFTEMGTGSSHSWSENERFFNYILYMHTKKL